MGLEEVLAKYRANKESNRDLGTKFEELIRNYLLTDPTYESYLDGDNVVLWRDFFAKDQLGGKDLGIDLVAKDRDGGYWAIQCKCYSNGHRISKQDVDTFISTSGKRFKEPDGTEVKFTRRMIISTTDDWGENAYESILSQDPPVESITLSMLENALVDWDELENNVHGKKARKGHYRLKKHQEKALSDALEHFATNDRGMMLMACGTGKTFTSLRIAEAIVKRDVPEGQKAVVLFLAPSISLVGQTLREWLNQAETDITPICVCSDATVSKERNYDDPVERTEDLGIPSTTDPELIVKTYKKTKEVFVIFSTYQSLDAVINAQKKGLPEIDLIVCDEAHKTIGILKGNDEYKDNLFSKVHSNDNISAKKRLYMTATPRIYGEKGKKDANEKSVIIASMDDPDIYGNTFYKISFGDAVESDLLSDYRVIILQILSSKRQDLVNILPECKMDDKIKALGCLHALAKYEVDNTLKEEDPHPMTSAVAFASKIERSKETQKLFNEVSKSSSCRIKNFEMRHIDGSMNATTRDSLLRWLAKDNGGTRVLTNVRCLSEGVDVPALDAAIFLNGKGSKIDIVQSVGRVMRKADGKKYGYIIIPIIIDEDQDPNEALDNNKNYQLVWDVLNALRSHDERLEPEISEGIFNKHVRPVIIGGPGPKPKGGDSGGSSTGKVTLDDFNECLKVRIVAKVGNRAYIEDWARDISKVVPKMRNALEKVCLNGTQAQKADFKEFMGGIRDFVNSSVTDSQGIDMLVQQMVTMPIFETLFGKGGFAEKNPIIGYLDRMIKSIESSSAMDDIRGDLGIFHKTVSRNLENIHTNESRQHVIKALYEKFFKNAFKKDQVVNGVVYTPDQIVDFILRSADAILKKEFGRGLSDANVNILDPYTGTGTFITKLLESGLIKKEDLYRKYANELFANEITLLAYYIACVNIETTFMVESGREDYVPFENIVLTDTFDIRNKNFSGIRKKSIQTTLGPTQDRYFSKNSEIIDRENDTPITVIVGNPPYGATQKSANDNAKKRKYSGIGGIDSRINETYLSPKVMPDKGNVNSVYDNYIRAFRWASDRLEDGEGVISFVTPNGWLTGSAFVGFRKCLETEFSDIYVYNLRGDATTQGQQRRNEGDGIFGDGSRVGIAITLLVKKPSSAGKATIHYFQVADCMKRAEKLSGLVNFRSFSELVSADKMQLLRPDENGDWIVKRNAVFATLAPLAGDTHKKFEKHIEKTVFVGYSRGYGTSRDSWSYNFSKDLESTNSKNMTEEYNSLLASKVKVDDIKIDPTKLSWDGNLFKLFENGTIGNEQTRFSLRAYSPIPSSNGTCTGPSACRSAPKVPRRTRPLWP